MSDNPSRCPFCGAEPALLPKFGAYRKMRCWRVEHDENCFLYGVFEADVVDDSTLSRWNSRLQDDKLEELYGEFKAAIEEEEQHLVCSVRMSQIAFDTAAERMAEVVYDEFLDRYERERG